MNQTPLKAAVIGGGKISEDHLRFLRQDPNASLMAICDLSPALAKFAAQRFGVPRTYTEHHQLLSEVRPDVVHILTPPHTHARLIIDCLQAGCDVLCEKPLAMNNAEFRELWKLASERRRLLIEDHNYRFNQPILEIEKSLRSGILGEVTEVDVRLVLGIRNPGGRYSDENLPHPSHLMPAGVVHEFITHICYLLLRFTGGFDRVAAAWRNYGGGDLFKYDDLDALVMNGPVHGRLRFSCRSAPETFMVSVRGTRGWAETDLFQPYLRLVKQRAGGSKLGPLVNHVANGWGLMRAGATGFRNKVLQHTPLEGMRTFLTRTYAALAAGKEPPVSFDDMDGASRLVDSLLAKENQL